MASNVKLLGLGLLILLVGISMPAETTEKVWEDGYPTEVTEENDYKYPLMVGGVVLAAASFLIEDRELFGDNDVSDNPPED